MSSPPSTSPPSVRLVLDSLRELVQGVRQESLAVEQKYGISGAQLFVLLQLREQSASSINDLAERTMTHQSSVSVVVSKLERKGFVRRVRSAADARRVEIRLAPKGRRLISKAPPPFQERLAAGLRAMKEAERKSVLRALARVNTIAGWSTGKPSLFFEPPSQHP